MDCALGLLKGDAGVWLYINSLLFYIYIVIIQEYEDMNEVYVYKSFL
jgi:hypothetical protein